MATAARLAGGAGKVLAPFCQTLMLEWNTMGKTPNEKIADKLIALFSDSRIGIVDWQHYIPFYITQQNKQIISMFHFIFND